MCDSYHFGAFIERAMRITRKGKSVVMARTHRERIQRLESRFDEFETGMARVTNMERMLGRVLRNQSKGTGSSSSSSESSDFDSGSEGGLIRHRIPDEEQPIRDNNQWRGKPKLTCPTFDDTDPVSWLSRVSKFFDLNEIKKSNKVKYAAYYFEGEANIWW